MADKAPKGKSVLGTLPASRPERLGAPRSRATKRAPAKPAAPTRRAARNGAAAKPRAVRRTPGEPKLAAKQRPRAVRPASPPLHTQRSTPPPEPLGAPKGTELVTTAIRATGELAQIGFVLGGKALKRTLDRLPRPGS